MSDVAKCEGIKHYNEHWGSWIDDHCFDCERRRYPSGEWQIWMSPYVGSGKCSYKIYKIEELNK